MPNDLLSICSARAPLMYTNSPGSDNGPCRSAFATDAGCCYRAASDDAPPAVRGILLRRLLVPDLPVLSDVPRIRRSAHLGGPPGVHLLPGLPVADPVAARA